MNVTRTFCLLISLFFARMGSIFHVKLKKKNEKLVNDIDSNRIEPLNAIKTKSSIKTRISVIMEHSDNFGNHL